MSDGSGQNLQELFAFLCRDTSSWKMSQGCLFVGSVTFSGIWPRSGLMQDGIVYRQQRLVPPTAGTRRQGCWTQCGLGEGQGKMQAGGESWWATESGVCRVANGIPNRMDRLRALGNSVVPQVVEWIGRRIMALTPPAPAGKE
jgi:hypothetical protein